MENARVENERKTITLVWWFLTWGPQREFKESVTWMGKTNCLCFTNLYVKYSGSSHYETKQQTSVVLSVPGTLFPIEITDIFSSPYNCCRYLKISFIFITYQKLQ